MQAPSEPAQYSQPIIFTPLRLGVMDVQLSKVQVASIVTDSPAQVLHVHVISPFEFSTAVTTHGGQSFVAAQQPLLPGLEPSAHAPAEAQAAAKTSTRNVVRVRAIDRCNLHVNREIEDLCSGARIDETQLNNKAQQTRGLRRFVAGYSPARRGKHVTAAKVKLGRRLRQKPAA